MDLADLATPMSIRVAATLGLAGRAGTEGATADRLATDTGSHEPALRRLLDHLVSVGVFDHDPDTDRYRPTSLGAQMSADAPEGVSILLDIDTAGGRGELAFVDLLHTVTTGGSAYAHRYGRDFWDDLDAHPHLRRSFDAQMNWRFRQQAPQIAERFDWSRFRRILDVYLLSDIVHDWDDGHARQILTRCRDAAATDDAAVVLIEPVRGHGAGTGIDLFMLLCFGGRERSIDELTRLAANAGLEPRSVVPVADGRMALELTVAVGGQ